MTAKQYLSQIRRLDNMISNKFAEIYQAKSMVSSITVLNDSERVQTSQGQDRMGDMMAKIIDLETEAESLVDKYTEIRRKIIHEIDLMPNENHYKVLHGRYIDGKTFDEISADMNYSWRQVIRIHGDALAEFEKLYGGEIAKMSLNVICPT